MSGGGFSKYAVAEAGVAAAGMVLAYVVPRTSEGKWAALLGVGAAALSGAVALWMKRGAVGDSDLPAGLVSVAVSFGLRTVVMVGGLAWVTSRAGETLAYVVGFFGAYFVQQAIEIAYVLEARRGTGQDE